MSQMFKKAKKKILQSIQEMFLRIVLGICCYILIYTNDMIMIWLPLPILLEKDFNYLESIYSMMFCASTTMQNEHFSFQTVKKRNKYLDVDNRLQNHSIFFAFCTFLLTF